MVSKAAAWIMCCRGLDMVDEQGQVPLDGLYRYNKTGGSCILIGLAFLIGPPVSLK